MYALVFWWISYYADSSTDLGWVWMHVERRVKDFVHVFFSFSVFLSKSAYDANISVFCLEGRCRILFANVCFRRLWWLPGNRILLFFLSFFFCICHIHMEMGGRGGTESHINLIWSWIAASVWTDPEQTLKALPSLCPQTRWEPSNIFKLKDARVYVLTYMCLH